MTVSEQGTLDEFIVLLLHPSLLANSFASLTVIPLQEWQETCVVATPAQLLSTPRVRLLNELSVEALTGLR